MNKYRLNIDGKEVYGLPGQTILEVCKENDIFISFVIALLQITRRTISLQEVHLWMEISVDCPNRGRRSLTKMDRPRNVQSSVWTLQQILPDRLPFDSVYNSLSPNHPEGNR